MAIFKINEARVEKVDFNPNGFGNEFALRDFFAANLEALLGVRFLANEYQTSDGRIDTLGLDESGSPVIIEYKWKENEEALTQGLSYLRWLIENKKHFNLLVESKLGADVEVAWESPRVIIVAQGFSKRTRDAVPFTQFVELKSYNYYGTDTLQIESIFTPKAPKRIAEKREVAAGTEENTAEYGLDYHFSVTEEAVSKKAHELRERLLQLPEVEEIAEQKSGITYRTTRSFTRFEFKKTWVQILLREPVYASDTEKLVRDVTTYRWGFLGMIKLTADSDVDYIYQVIKDSYESTL